jgi:tetratricopeptide (TPR) repeat protein
LSDRLLGYYAQASKVAEMIQTPEYKADALVEIVAELIEKDKVSALRHLADALRSANEIRDSRKRNDLMRSITRQHAHLGQVEIAEQLSHILEKRDSKTALEAIALYYAKTGDFDRALEYAMKLDRANSDQQVTLMRIAVSYAERGHFEKALQTADKISEPRRDNDFFRDEALETISRCYIKAGNYDEALLALSRMSDNARKVYVLVDLAEIYRDKKIQPSDRTKKILHAIIRADEDMQ